MFFYRRFAILIFSVLLLQAGISFAAADSNIPDKISDSKIFRTMTYNVRREGPESKPEREWPHRLHLVCAVIAKLKPDIFGLQEPTEKQINQIAETLKSNDFTYESFGEGRGESWGGRGANEFNPIFYNPELFDLLDQGTFSINTVDSFWGYWMPWQYKQTGLLPRICTWGKFKQRATGQEFYFYNTHFDHQYEEARELCAQSVAKHIAEKNNDQLPVIITGDFNARFEHAIEQTLASFTPAIRMAPITGGPRETETGWTEDKLKEIDHILITEKTEALTHFVVTYESTVLPSDHRPVIADLKFIQQ